MNIFEYIIALAG